MSGKKSIYYSDERKQPAIVFLSISLALFLAFIGFFAWHTARMRSYELDYIKVKGTVVDIKQQHSTTDRHTRTYYYLVISYEFEGKEYTFTDRTGYHTYESGWIGGNTNVYVNPQNPSQAERVKSSGFVSIISSCFFAFYCATYAVGMNLLLSIKGTSYKKRLLFVWGIEILLGVAFVLLCWLGLPHSSFGEIFVRIEGAVGITVVSGLVLCAALLDGIITRKRFIKMYR